LLAIVRDDDVCHRLMTIPGVGPVVALTFRVTVDVPARFRNSKAVGAVFGLTPSRYQSGESERTGTISRCGDEMMRMMLYEAAQSMTVPNWERARERDTTQPPALHDYPLGPANKAGPFSQSQTKWSVLVAHMSLSIFKQCREKGHARESCPPPQFGRVGPRT
jgi:Transposase IS116/IS110/IS902 family